MDCASHIVSSLHYTCSASAWIHLTALPVAAQVHVHGCAGVASITCHAPQALILSALLHARAARLRRCWIPLQATVGEASLDPAAVLFKQQIQLTNVPVGTARVVFNAADFGNFLVHPLMTEAAKEAVEVRA
jgi:hypothetical protein